MNDKIVPMVDDFIYRLTNYGPGDAKTMSPIITNRQDPDYFEEECLCHYCNGDGYVYEYDKYIEDFTREDCPVCGGTGIEILDNLGEIR